MKKKNNRQKKIWWFVLVLCMCFWMMGSVQAAELLEQEIILDETSGDWMPAAGGRGSISLFSARMDGFSWGSQLYDGNQSAIYEGLERAENLMEYNKSHYLTIALAEPVLLSEDTQLSTYKTDSAYISLLKDFYRATHAYFKDSISSTYWIYGSVIAVYKSEVEAHRITQINFRPVDYYEGVRDEVAETNDVIKAAERSIQGSTDYEKVKYIHDYVCQLITYPGDPNPNPYHTLPSAWLSSYDNLGVCEAYAKSFAKMCQEMDIEAICVTGGSKRDSAGNVKATHMWNYVQLEGVWYLVDCTWDDHGSQIGYSYFLSGSESSAYNHIPVGCYLDTEENAAYIYDSFYMPTISTADYKGIREIESTDFSIHEGDKQKVEATFLPGTAVKGTAFTYESSDSAIVKVDSLGVASGISAGTATIRIRSEKYPTISKEIVVTVSAHDYVDEIVTAESTCSTQGTVVKVCSFPGCGARIKETLEVDGSKHTRGEWKETKAATCTETGEKRRTCKECGLLLDDARSIAKADHEVGSWKVVTAATCIKEGKKVCYCSVCNQELASEVIPKTKAIVKLNYTALPLQVGKSTSGLKISSQDKNDSVVKWISSDSTILKVDANTGTLKGLRIGTAVVTVKMLSGAKATCKVTVQKSLVLTKTLTLSKSKISLQVNKKYTVKATRYPVTAGDELFYATSNKCVATVSATGVITAKKKGTATITIKTKKGVYVKLTVSVTS